MDNDTDLNPQARLTIDLGALAKNWQTLASLAKSAEAGAVVKADAYGIGIESAVRSLNATGFRITQISDVTPIPHNGCRPPKQRRV